jgi:hypothetical protein
LGKLRKGDELHAFHAGFCEMYEAIRSRVVKDVDVLAQTIATLENMPARSPELERTLEALRVLHQEKVHSLSSLGR